MARSKEDIKVFLEGRNPMKHIISMECGYQDQYVSIIYRDDDGKKMIRKEEFHPFVWAKGKICQLMCKGDRNWLKKKMAEYHITCKELNIFDENGLTNKRMEDGYRYMWYATRPTDYSTFLRFFQECGTPVFARKSKKYEKLGLDGREFLQVPPVEQFMIQSGMRLFKEYDNYDDLVRMLFDIETEGLDPKKHAISQIGVRTNKGTEKIIPIHGEGEERRKNEYQAIKEFYKTIGDEKPDVIAGHNSENFDFPFIDERFRILGGDPLEVSRRFIRGGVYKRNKEAVLKLGGEVEYYKPTIIWGTNVIDSLHAVRRAQAIDSNMKSAGLKYATKYINMEKENRVYVDGGIINETWLIKDKIFAFNDKNGHWYPVDDEHPQQKGYEMVSGQYIVERYLLDDLYETDMVELKFNESNFLINKFIPTTFTRACTMGTAGIWKLIMLAWSFENKLAVPSFVAKRRFVGGLSRLLCVGYIAGNGIVKLDYNSLYPSIIITWCIESGVDISKVMVSLLAFVLEQRELYKGLKGDWGDKATELAKMIEENTLFSEEEKHELIQRLHHAKAEKVANDKKQLPFKIFGNSFFGAFGNSDLFPFGDCDVAEKVTCIGRQSLRLMIHHFSTRKPCPYKPLVGDSVTADTPLFIKYNKSGWIDIKPISELMDENAVQKDVLGREYDSSAKPFKVLCRSGWAEPSYIYRHDVNKPIYRVEDGKNVMLDCTEDHSLYNSNQEKIKPSEINASTELEFYNGVIKRKGSKLKNKVTMDIILLAARELAIGRTIDRVPMFVLNATKDIKHAFYKEFIANHRDDIEYSKTCLAGIKYVAR